MTEDGRSLAIRLSRFQDRLVQLHVDADLVRAGNMRLRYASRDSLNRLEQQKHALRQFAEFLLDHPEWFDQESWEKLCWVVRRSRTPYVIGLQYLMPLGEALSDLGTLADREARLGYSGGGGLRQDRAGLVGADLYGRIAAWVGLSPTVVKEAITDFLEDWRDSAGSLDKVRLVALELSDLLGHCLLRFTSRNTAEAWALHVGAGIRFIASPAGAVVLASSCLALSGAPARQVVLVSVGAMVVTILTGALNSRFITTWRSRMR